MEGPSDAWRSSVDLGDDWGWRDGKLWHRFATIAQRAPTAASSRLQSIFVGLVYADQNRSKAVRTVLGDALRSLEANSVALNIGAGGTALPGVVNLEIADGPNIQIIGHGSSLPFRSGTVDLVIAQEVLEHVDDFLGLVREIHRVLRPDGRFVCQVPFQIGFHPGPQDYWRFTRQGLEYLFRAPAWEIVVLRRSLGHGSGFYRIAVEFLAVTFGCVVSRLYKPAKAASAILLYPLKWFDLLTDLSAEADRIPGGYICVARKSGDPSCD